MVVRAGKAGRMLNGEAARCREGFDTGETPETIRV
jgi:hypothetical protein